MKSYIFDLGNTNNTNSSSTNVSSYTESLFNKALGSVPYWNSSKVSRFQSTPKAPDFVIPFTLERKSPLFNPYYKYQKVQRDLDIYEAWTAAMNKMKAYRSHYGDRSYDALVGGIPANFFGDFVQIGDVVVPTYVNRGYFDRMSQKNKIEIISISIEIVNVFVI